MQISKPLIATAASILTMALAGTVAQAKGLEELSESNPETEAAQSAAAKGEGGSGDSKSAANLPPSALSKSISQKLFMATSFGWVIPSKSSGDWKCGNSGICGMSDLMVGYVLPLNLGTGMDIAGTYRYAPVAVAGVEDGHSYRGMWETHYVGGRFHYALGANFRAVGSFELGYVRVSLNDLDNLGVEHDHEKNGGSVALGGGADLVLAEKLPVTAGPRLYVGLGSVTTIQIAGAINFMF